MAVGQHLLRRSGCESRKVAQRHLLEVAQRTAGLRLRQHLASYRLEQALIEFDPGRGHRREVLLAQSTGRAIDAAVGRKHCLPRVDGRRVGRRRSGRFALDWRLALTFRGFRR